MRSLFTLEKENNIFFFCLFSPNYLGPKVLLDWKETEEEKTETKEE